MYPSIYWGDILRLFRRKNHLLQKEVASILKISRQSYSQLEVGRVQPTPEQLAVLSNIYGINLIDYVCKCFPAEYVAEQTQYRIRIKKRTDQINEERARERLPLSLEDEDEETEGKKKRRRNMPLFTDRELREMETKALIEDASRKARKINTKFYYPPQDIFWEIDPEFGYNAGFGKKPDKE